MRRGRCRQKGCSNTFTEIIGGDGWGMGSGKRLYGDCLPCHFATQLHHTGLTPEQIQTHQQLGDGIRGALERGGWSWADLLKSYQRTPHPVMM